MSTDELMIIKEGRTVPRKGHIAKRDVLADPIYNNKVVTKLINNIMLDGKKGIAQKIVYGAFARVEQEAGKPALEVFEEAMNNIMPVLEVKARRIGGATYQVPIDVRPDKLLSGILIALFHQCSRLKIFLFFLLKYLYRNI